MAMPVVSVEVGFSVGAGTSTYLHLDDSARGKIGSGILAPEAVWTDVTSYLQSLHCSRGVSRADGPVLTYEAGKCTIRLRDDDRRFDPDNLAGPYVSGGVTQVTPMRAIRIRATWSGVTYDLWRGYIDSWQTVYEGPNSTHCILQATDGTKVLNAYDRAAVAAVGGSEDSGARISRILDSAAWSATDRVIGTGNSTLQSTTLAGSAWNEMVTVAESEIGELYFDGAGRVVFRSRLAVLEESRSNTSQATFGDDGGSELPYQDVFPDYDDQQLYNVARVTREGGVEQTAQDSESITQYLTHVFEQSGLLLETDDAAADYAGWIVYQAKDPERRFSQLVVNPRADEATLFPHCLGREIGDRLTIKRRPPGGGAVITRDVIIRGVEHTFDAQMAWITTWNLQSASRLSFLTLDHASLGTLNSNALAF